MTLYSHHLVGDGLGGMYSAMATSELGVIEIINDTPVVGHTDVG